MPVKFNVPYESGNEIFYLKQVIEQKFFSGNGPFTKRVQAWLENRYGVPHVLLTHSCTAALEMSALLLDLGPDDEVILPSYTFTSTAAAYLRTGARLVFCEIDPKTMNIDAKDVARRLTSKTRAIVVVHYGGIGADTRQLMELVESKGIQVVEDAAQGLDAKRGDRWLGTIAPMSTISFHETKNLHCGLGGALFLNDVSYFDRAENIWERGTDRSKVFKGLVDKYSWVELGSSFYPTELQAAFLLAQLESIDRNTRLRRCVYEIYYRRLKPMEQRGLFLLPEVPSDCLINFHSCFIIANSVEDCDQIRVHLRGCSIQAYIGYVPLHSSKMGRKLGYQAEDLPLTENFSQRVLRLPFHHLLSEGDIDSVCDEIEKSLK
jgi:dTDP-4-amino-4,6-dideoxygalactose transaminase